MKPTFQRRFCFFEAKNCIEHHCIDQAEMNIMSRWKVSNDKVKKDEEGKKEVDNYTPTYMNPP